MKILLKLVLSLTLTLCLIGSANAYYNPGNPTGYVTDFTNTLNEITISGLNQDLAAFEKETAHQIFVAIISSMKGDYIDYFAVKLFEDWKPGYKGLDNGVLFLISMEERRMRIEVGYGLESVLTDSKASQIINDIAKPYFQKGDFNTGVAESVNAIKQIIKGEVVDFSKVKIKSTNSPDILDMIIGFFVVGSFIAFPLLRMTVLFSKSKAWWPGGVVGGIAGTALSFILFDQISIWFILVASAFAGAGLLLDYLASTGKIKIPEGKGGRRGFWGGFGGGGGGGGFGGGGGGGSGGGGASGGW